VTVGVVSTSCLFISRRADVPQHWLVASRGLGLIFGPTLLARIIGRATWSGESQTGYVLLLTLKALSELSIPRANSTLFLLVGFFGVGIVQASLDLWRTLLVTLVHRERCGSALVVYAAIYGVGSMIAPFMTVANPMQAWDALAAIDFLLAAVLGSKRLYLGKPRDWKLKIRGVLGSQGPDGDRSNTSSCCQSREGSLPGSPAQKRVPRRVLRAGIVFIALSEAAETAMSAWSFTYAATSLKLPSGTAAMFPTAFYMAFTAMRLALIPLSRRMAPSAIVQRGALLMLVSAVSFYFLTQRFLTIIQQADAPELVAPGAAWPLLLCLAFLGTGSCPLYGMMLASVRQHGSLTAQETGWYDTSCNLGITLGLWLPGWLGLPSFELLFAGMTFCVLSSHMRDFPWWGKVRT